jgi:hypothetical protein
VTDLRCKQPSWVAPNEIRESVMSTGIHAAQAHVRLAVAMRSVVGVAAALAALSTTSPAQAQTRQTPCRQSDVYGWVAELPATLMSCPVPSQAWALRSFPLDASSRRTLCSYEWTPSSEPTLVGLPKGLHYTPDCMAIGVHQKQLGFQSQTAPALPASVDIAEIQENFLDALDAPRAITPLRAALTKDAPTLGFIDALPVAAPAPQLGAVQHGNSLATLATLLGGCNKAPCRFRFSWHEQPALFPYPGGKVVGSPLDSAQAIAKARHDFLLGPSPHLVIEIGLGFEPDERCAAMPDSPVVVALREAIRRTACDTGAIILAPVGNTRNDDVSTGMLYPAKFVDEELVCNGVAQGRPLVTAFSGVDMQLRPLASSRAIADLATFGGPWAYAGDGLDDQLNPSTASSVAVAAAAPIISLAWSLRPDLDAQGLLSALDQAGVAGKGRAANSSIIRACATLEKLCADSSQGHCTDFATLCPANRNPGPRLPLTAAATTPAADSGTFPREVCLGRGQRIEPSGPGE